MDAERFPSRWPVLKSATDVTCDGLNPRTDAVCILGHHHGYHRDRTGDEWLDDGDLSRPDW